jgi:hypothetical protein
MIVTFFFNIQNSEGERIKKVSPAKVLCSNIVDILSAHLQQKQKRQ